MGSPEIENDGVIGFGVAQEMAFLAILGGIDDIAGVGESRNQLTVQIGIVLNHQQSHVKTPV